MLKSSMLNFGRRTGKKRIGLISALPSEAGLVAGGLGAILPGSGHELLYMASGIGISNAAHAATLLIERHMPSLVIVFGTGGAYRGSGLGNGDIAVAEKEIYADSGVIGGKGQEGFEAIGIPLVSSGGRRFFNEFPFRRGLVRKAVRAAEGALGLRAASGVFLTVSSSSGTLGRAGRLAAAYGAVCENMEGAAVAQICSIYGLDMLEIRGISNRAGMRDKKKWDIETASLNAQRAVIETLKVV